MLSLLMKRIFLVLMLLPMLVLPALAVQTNFTMQNKAVLTGPASLPVDSTYFEEFNLEMEPSDTCDVTWTLSVDSNSSEYSLASSTEGAEPAVIYVGGGKNSVDAIRFKDVSGKDKLSLSLVCISATCDAPYEIVVERSCSKSASSVGLILVLILIIIAAIAMAYYFLRKRK